MLVEPQRSRRELGGTLGADKLIDPTAVDVAEAVNAHIGAQGADVVIECAGIPKTIEQAVSLARRGGMVSLVGVPNRPAQIQAAEWLVKEVRLTTSLAYLREEFDIAQGLVADGRIRCGALHTSTVSLQQMGDAFERLSDSPARDQGLGRSAPIAALRKDPKGIGQDRGPGAHSACVPGEEGTCAVRILRFRLS